MKPESILATPEMTTDRPEVRGERISRDSPHCVVEVGPPFFYRLFGVIKIDKRSVSEQFLQVDEYKGNKVSISPSHLWAWSMSCLIFLLLDLSDC